MQQHTSSEVTVTKYDKIKKRLKLKCSIGNQVNNNEKNKLYPVLNNKERVFDYRRFHLGRQMNWVKNDFVPSSHAPNRTSCQSYFLAINLARHVLRNKADRLRVVPLSLCPSCMTRKKTARKKRPRDASCPRSSRGHFSLVNIGKDHHDKLKVPDPPGVEDLISYKLNNR